MIFWLWGKPRASMGTSKNGCNGKAQDLEPATAGNIAVARPSLLWYSSTKLDNLFI
jgi:hypothetical protein